MELRKRGPSKAIPRLSWNVSVSSRDPRVLDLFEMKHRAGTQVHVGDSKNSTRRFKTKEAAWEAMWKLVDAKLAEGYEWRSDEEREKYEAERRGAAVAPPEPEVEKPSKPWAKGRAKRPAWLAKVRDQVAVVDRAITRAHLAHRRDDILSLSRAGVRFKLSTVKKVKGVVTRFGGAPDVPAGFRWPMQGKVPLAFVAQIRCDELRSLDFERKLPSRGLLSMFAYLVADERYGQHAQVFHFPDVAKLGTLAPPHDADADGRPAKMALAAPSARLTLAHPDSDLVASLKLTGDEHTRYHDDVWLATNGVRDAPSKPGSHQLLGWPDQMDEHSSERGWELLAQIDSDDRFGLEIGDVETLRFHVASAKLRAHNFDRVRSAIGGV